MREILVVARLAFPFREKCKLKASPRILERQREIFIQQIYIKLYRSILTQHPSPSKSQNLARSLKK